jgi:hypothetical protein
VEYALNQTVVIEGAPGGFFKFDLHWSPGNDNQLRTAIEQELGVKTEVVQRRMQFIVVNRMPLPGREK